MSSRKKLSIQSETPPENLMDHPFYGIPLDDEQRAFAQAIWDPENDIIFCNAKAGTGKTTIATGAANLLCMYGFFDSIIYIMSPYGEKLGYLPGDITEKSSVYFEPFYQAMVSCNINPYTAVNDESLVNQKNGSGYITCITDTYLRGSNLNNCVVIIDEAQNYTTSQLKKVLTRVGDRAKVIVIGHDLQCDLKKKELSGFVSYINHFAGQDRCAVCQLTTNHRGWISRWADELDERTKGETVNADCN